MNLLRPHHTGFTVSNLDNSIGFYEAIGMTCTFRAERNEPFIGEVVGMPGAVLRIAYMQLGESEHFLELLEYVRPRGEATERDTNLPGNGHLCFEVDDVDAWARRMKGRLTGKAMIPDGPNKGTKVAYARDPDGFTLELLQKPSPQPAAPL